MLHILSLLPDVIKTCTARRVCKAAHHDFNHHTLISLSSTALPLVALQEAYYAKRHDSAVILSKLHIMQLHGAELRQEQLAAARAACGDLAGLQWLRSQSCSWDSLVCEKAAAGGHLEVIKWCRSQHPRCPWSSDVLNAAAEVGQLDIIRWARQQKSPCPLDGAKLCSHAAKGGQLEVLHWARQQTPPCTWDASVCYTAAQAGQVRCTPWGAIRAHSVLALLGLIDYFCACHGMAWYHNVEIDIALAACVVDAD